MVKTSKCADCGKRLTISAVKCAKCGSPVKMSTVPSNKSDTTLEKKGVMWAYITGTLFIVTGLGAFQIGILPALLLIFGGVLALPLVRVGLVKMSGFATDKPLIIASTVLIIFGVISYTSSVKSDRLDKIAADTSVNE